jgi:alkanesulfonate monooxygenase SsuD/methylene tetrahydromethanopterin reductase-like flavin-dependent oxidoreductase (luciferase family)
MIHLSIALDGTGWHPAAWREPRARPAELFTARYWADLVAEAEHGFLDFVTIEDGLSLQGLPVGTNQPASSASGPDERTGLVQGRLDAVLIAARVAPLTRYIGLMPTVNVTHTEPFHISKAIATLDYVSAGRAAVRVRVSANPAEAAHFGRRTMPRLDLLDRADLRVQALVSELFDEAADYVEVIRRLWDSWEDDAEIRDSATGRFIDREKLHYIDFAGRHFSVRGPSITPRPPQGQPPVAVLAHGPVPYTLAARAADVVFVTPGTAPHAADIVAQVRAAEFSAERTGAPLQIHADLTVFLDQAAGEPGAVRKSRLDELAGQEYVGDAMVFTGSTGELADLLLEWHEAGVSGFRLRPGVIPDDLEAITRGLVLELRRRGAYRASHPNGRTFRGVFGMPRPENRYAGAGPRRPPRL